MCITLLVGACTDDGGGSDETTTSTIPPARTLLRVGVDAWPDCLNPLTCAVDGSLPEQILQHVLPVAMEVDGSGQYVPSPLLAGNPQVEVDGETLTVTYRINSAARWSDGRPITSSDFRATWLAVMATPEADQSGYREVVSVDDSDPGVAVVELARPLADWPELFGGSSGWVLQGDALGERLDLTGRFRDELPFSAGPFRLAAWDRDVAVLAADDTYWDVERIPEIDQVRIERRDADDGLRGFDFIVGDPTRRDDTPDGFDLVRVPTTEVIGIWFDRRTTVLEPKTHRDALAVAFDRGELAALAAGGDEPLLTCLGWIPGVGPWCDDSDLPEGVFEPDLARFALAIDGWVAGDDGILARGAERFALTVTHDPALPGADDVAAELVDRLADIGIEVSVGDIEADTWTGLRSPDESAGVGVFSFDVGVSPQVLDLYGCLGGVESSVIGWCPRSVTTLAAAMVDASDPAELLALAQEIGDVAAGDLAWIPLVQRHHDVFVRSGRVSLPPGRPVVGGALARLYDLEVEDS